MRTVVYYLEPCCLMVPCMSNILVCRSIWSWNMRRREQYSMFATLAGSKLSLGTDHLTCRCGGVMVCCFVQSQNFFLSHEWFVVSFRFRIFFCRTKREFFFQNITLGYMTKTLIPIVAEKNILILVEEKRKFDSEFLSYNLMLYSGKKIRASCDKKKF